MFEHKEPLVTLKKTFYKSGAATSQARHKTNKIQISCENKTEILMTILILIYHLKEMKPS